MAYKQEYMELAIELAKKGTGAVNPNPLVGAVIVKDDRIIGQGYHARYGDCLLYTSDAADEEDSGDLGGRRSIKKKKNTRQAEISHTGNREAINQVRD